MAATAEHTPRRGRRLPSEGRRLPSARSSRGRLSLLSRRQQRARGREGVRQQRETEQRAAEQHVAGQHAAERVAERMARDTEMPGINLLGQNNDMEDFEQGGGTSGNDAPPCYRSLSVALTVRGSDQEDDDDDDVSMMAGSEATNHEEDPGYASDLYGADTEDMEE